MNTQIPKLSNATLNAMRPIPLRSWTLVLSSSLLQLLPFPIAGPVPLWRRYVCWFCLVPLLFVITSPDKKLTVRQAAVLGYACGFFWYLGNCYWIYQTMHFYGQIPKPGAMGILVLFSLYLGLYLAFFAALLRFISRRCSTSVGLCVSPFLWVAVELARARITGFPWDLLGYTQVDSLVLMKLAPIAGVMGVSFVTACVNASWLLRVPRYTKQIGIAAASFLALACSVRMPAANVDAPVTAVLLQENLSVGGEAPKTLETREQMLMSFQQLSLRPQVNTKSFSSHPDITIWPEAPADFIDTDPAFREALGEVARKSKSPVIADSISPAPPDVQGQPHFYNTASFFAANGEHVGRYDKMHLVPFGEYTPYKQLFFFAGHLLDNVGPFVPGNIRQLLTTGGHRYGVFICYESIFGDEIREFTKNGADVLVNISDDGWYGDTSAPWEHLDMVRMRAIENSRWVLRSTNTGVTAVINPSGQLTSQLPRHIRSSMASSFGYRENLTFYTRNGDWFAWLCVVICGAAVIYGLNRRQAVN